MEILIALITLIWHFLTAIITGAIADSKNRSKVGWGFIGFFLQLLGIIWIALMQPLEE